MSARFHKIDERARMPVYATSGSAGADLCALLFDRDGIGCEHVIPAGCWASVSTGLGVHIAAGYEIQIRPRSGLAMHHGVTVLNAPATIDSDYEGEIRVLLFNHGSEDFILKDGDRIAQAVLARVEKIACPTADAVRGAGGFGSTGQGEIK